MSHRILLMFLAAVQATGVAASDWETVDLRTHANKARPASSSAYGTLVSIAPEAMASVCKADRGGMQAIHRDDSLSLSCWRKFRLVWSTEIHRTASGWRLYSEHPILSGLPGEEAPQRSALSPSDYLNLVAEECMLAGGDGSKTNGEERKDGAVIEYVAISCNLPTRKLNAGIKQSNGRLSLEMRSEDKPEPTK